MGADVSGTASADPDKLDVAAEAVPVEVRDRLSLASTALDDAIARFQRGTQSPERVTVSTDLPSGLATTVQAGGELDGRLARAAVAFRRAGADTPPGFVGPGVPGGVVYLDDDALRVALAPPDLETSSLQFNRRPDGTLTVTQGGQEYVVVDAPPPGTLPTAVSEGVVDLGNPDFPFILAAAAVIGLTGGQTQPMDRSAPPSAYQYIHIDEYGYAVPAAGVTGHTRATAGLPPQGADVPQTTRAAAADAVAQLGGALSELGKHSDARFDNVFRMQTTFYEDPVSGEQVAVVNAASIRYDNDSNEAVIVSGRLSVGDDGQPTLIAPPKVTDPSPQDTDYCPPGTAPSIGPSPVLRVPLEED
jgi:hypothetical protein